MKCRTNISLPFEGERITVTLEVDFTLSPPDYDVGIMGFGVDEFTATVIDADLEDVTTEQLATLQAIFDRLEQEYVSEIDEACLASGESYYGDEP